MQNQINEKATIVDLEQETLDRINADANLQAQIDQEISDREVGDSNLQSAIDIESSRNDVQDEKIASIEENGVTPFSTVSGTLPSGTVAGWKRIAFALNDTTTSSGLFTLEPVGGGFHGSISFYASTTFNDSPSLTQLNTTTYDLYVEVVTKLRIVYVKNSVQPTAYLEYYHSDTYAEYTPIVTVDMINGIGWTLIDPTTIGEIPEGYTSKELILNDGIASTGIIDGNAGVVSQGLPVVTSVNGITADSSGNVIVSGGSGGGAAETGALLLTNSATESISGTATSQMSANTEFVTAIDGKLDKSGGEITGGFTTPSGTKIKGTGTGDINDSYLQFMESDNTTRRGFIGDGGTAHGYFTIASEIENLNLSIPSGKIAMVNGNEIWHEGNLDPSTIGGGNVYATTANIDYFVSGATGSDSNDGLTEGTPFLSVQKAIDSLPQIINHVIHIFIIDHDGSNFSQVYGFSGQGSINIKKLPTVSSANMNIVDISACSCFVAVSGLIVAEIYVRNTLGVFVSNCESPMMGVLFLVAKKGASVEISQCIINDKSTAFDVSENAIVLSKDNTGTNNGVVFVVSDGGVIARSGTQPTGGTIEAVSGGGEIR